MRYLLIIKYDGTRYHGWQVQKNALAVQAVVQNALGAVLGTPPDVTGCSRTDSGVHVNMYCCHFDTDKLIPERNIILAVNRALPDDISAYGCKAVDSSFHARYSATGKQYIYRFFNSPYRDAFLEQYTYRVFSHMDEALMNKAAAEMVGTYDFSSFCSVNAKEGSKGAHGIPCSGRARRAKRHLYNRGRRISLQYGKDHGRNPFKGQRREDCPG